MTVRPLARTVAVTTAVAMAVLASACGSKKPSADSGGKNGSAESVQVMMFPGQSYRLPVMIGEQQGFFAKHGVKISIVAQPNNLQGAQAMIATRSQVGDLSTATLAQGVENGSPVAFFCGGINVLQTTLFAKNGSSLPSTSQGASWQAVLKSLDGKKVGVQTPVGSGLQLLFAAALKEAGVTNVTYVNVGGGNNVTLAALNRGSVDVAQVNPTGTQAIEDANSAKPLMYMPSQGPEAYKLYGSAWAGQTAWLKSHPDTAKGFCAAMNEAVAFIKNPANAAVSTKALAADTGLSSSVAARVVKETYGDYSVGLPKDVLTNTFRFYKQIGITKTDMSGEFDKLVQPAS